MNKNVTLIEFQMLNKESIIMYMYIYQITFITRTY